MYFNGTGWFFFDMNILEYSGLLKCDTLPLDEWLQTIRKQKRNTLVFKDQAVQGEYTFQDGGIVIRISNLSQTK